MLQLINAGNQVTVNVVEIMCICPVSSLPDNLLNKAIDLSGGTKRSAIITRRNQTLLVDARYSTLKARAENALND